MNLLAGILSTLAVLCAVPSHAQDFASLSNKEASLGMKDVIRQGAEKSVALLGRPDGFLGNPKVKIPLPDALRQVEGGMRLLGMKRQADELVVAMNRAAESAIPDAKALLVEAVQEMSVMDAKAILTGGDTAATEYFRRATSAHLKQRFLPIVTHWTSKAGLADQYNSLIERGVELGVVRKDERIEHYVTRKALDGLYATIAEQERALRQNPTAGATNAARKVFGLLQ